MVASVAFAKAKQYGDDRDTLFRPGSKQYSLPEIVTPTSRVCGGEHSW